MHSFRQDKKAEEDNACSIFQSLDKARLLQETRYFNASTVNPRTSIYILTKIIYLLNQGETWTTQEATEIFFATTKLFQSKDINLRRLVYLCIKELRSDAQDVIIVTSSLTKDMTGKEDFYRAAAIRALCCITDSTMLQALERYMKQAIVDKNPAISSAALVSALHLTKTAPEFVRRWVEAQEVIMSGGLMTSYHAFGMVAASRQDDQLASAKLVSNLISKYGSLRSPYTLSLLVRHAAILSAEDPSELYINFIESCLRHKSEIVLYEAAHAILNLRNSTDNLYEAVSVLQMFCGSKKATLRLAGVRSLAKITERHPNAVSACVADLENLITDSNRSVATLAVTTLLATGTESSIERLLKQITSFLSEISDEYKIVVVHAIRRLYTKYPHKYQVLSAFLAKMLQDEGGLEYKVSVTEALITLVEEIPDAKENGLAHLCEFIEDCEHTSLAIRVLNVLGREGPKTCQPSKYIRYIYNRILLESSSVRAAAVTAFARFGAARPELLPNISVLLARCQLDDDDEVRDRAVFYGAILQSGDSKLINNYIINVPMPDPVLLAKAVFDHIQTNSKDHFNISTVPAIEETQETKESMSVIEVHKQVNVSVEEQYAKQVKELPGIEKLGVLFKTSKPIELTEPETEYRVRCIKHVFNQHIILQFECLNTLKDQLLENVTVRLKSTSGFKYRAKTACVKLPYNVPDSVFTVYKYPEILMDSLGTFKATLEFVVNDCDPATGIPDSMEVYADSYPLENIQMTCSEQMYLQAASDKFEETWQRASLASEACDTFGLAQNKIEEAALAVCDYLDLPKTAISGDTVKEIRGGGIFREGIPLLVKASLVESHGFVTMQISCRSPGADITSFVLATVG